MKTSMHDTAGMRDARSAVSCHARSLPRQVGGEFLELFQLAKEQDRLAKEEQRVSRRAPWIRDRLNDIGRQVKFLQSSAGSASCQLALQPPVLPAAKSQAARRGSESRFKTVTVRY